ncbi:LiaF domain-containing protein [Aliikangiella sp. G2MR2-5]|uniref:LiaF domain-containing protein n=1 Tax=Aliikangiella sp. G2MR2-5 TaxID=2788943 RepID=UPI0018AA34F0|nr:LiaF domain-containing protein [Aliikangiella sp. G2MR2-5]
MPVKPEDRPLHQVREEVIDQLIMNYGHDKLSLQAFEKRLDTAMEAKDTKTLLALTEDLDLVVDNDFVSMKKAQMSLNPELENGSHADFGDEVDDMVNIFGGSGRSGMWNVAREINVTNVFGGGDIDFTDAHFLHPTTHIKVFSLFGGSTFLVPEDINVRVKAFCIFGGVNNSAPSVNQPNVPTLLIEATSIFSGINIKVRRTLKQRFMRFAEGVKNMLS